ncbi:MAG: terminase gpA endonuclease subunit [Planctomycetota bacterium]
MSVPVHPDIECPVIADVVRETRQEILGELEPWPAERAMQWALGFPEIARVYDDRYVPPERVRPSEWAAENVIVPDGPGRGRFDPDFMPWTRKLLDLQYDHPHKQGVVHIKPSQIGSSQTMLTWMVCMLATDGGPTLYMTSTGDEAKKFASSRFKPMARSIEKLRDDLDHHKAEGRRILTQSMQLRSGLVDFEGAGSERGAISHPRRFVVLDEFELAERNFASQGDLYTIASDRMKLYRTNSWISVFGHPAIAEQDLDRLQAEYSDQGRWAWACPHCSEIVDPTQWEELIDWKGNRRPGFGATPDDAVIACRSCGCEISDAERRRAVLSPHKGGTGHRHVPIDEDEARTKPLLGFWVTQLSNPAVSLRDLAAGYLSKQVGNERKAWFNKSFGAPYREAKTSITKGDVEACVRRVESLEVPGGSEGAAFVASGADVQAPLANPTLYHVVGAFSPTGVRYIVDLAAISGWDGFNEYRRRWSVQRRDGDTLDRLPIAGTGVDAGYATVQVLENTRRAIYPEIGNQVIRQVAFNYNGKCSLDLPVADVPREKCIDKLNPRLGPVARRYLHRHTWIDRVIRLFREGRYVILCDVPDGFFAQMTNQYEAPIRKQHQLEQERFEWTKPKQGRDDWLHAFAMMEAMASIALGADQLYEKLTPKTSATTAVSIDMPERY